VSDFPRPSLAHDREQLARLDAELAEARRRRDDLDYQWGHAMYSAGCRRRPKDIWAALERAVALIAELEARREELTDAPANDSVLEPSAQPLLESVAAPNSAPNATRARAGRGGRHG
jgi:hypothetical protein